ncbi:18220_t:CDS:2, partial [Funneliformis geosporum]
EELVDDDFHWSEICTNWIDLINQQSFYAIGRNIHPADDETAKLKLKYLFKENLKAPTFLGIE